MAVMATTATTLATCSALLRALGTKLRASASRNRSSLPAASASPSALLTVAASAVLLCGGTTALSSVVAFFLPLLTSTSICCGAVYLLVALKQRDGGAEAVAKEVVLMCGGLGDDTKTAEVGILQLYGGANASAYGGRRDVQVSCFLRRGWCRDQRGGGDEDGEDVVFAGRLLSAAGVQDGATLEEELVALQVDRFAECVWDSFFGGCSTWHNYVTS